MAMGNYGGVASKTNLLLFFFAKVTLRLNKTHFQRQVGELEKVIKVIKKST